jgi:hypothetical protein
MSTLLKTAGLLHATSSSASAKRASSFFIGQNLK